MSRSFSKKIKTLGSTIINLLILGYIASWIFGIDIWILSELSIVQFVLLCIAISIISKGFSKMFETDKSYKKNQEQWQRWDNNDHKDYNYNKDYYADYSNATPPPPPPPPPNGSFSDYDPYKQTNAHDDNSSTNKDQYEANSNEFYSEKAKIKEQVKHYKKQAKHYKEQAKQYKEQAKNFSHQKKEEAKAYFNKYNDNYNDYTDEHYYDDYTETYHQNNGRKITHSMFIGEFKFKESYTQLHPMEVNGFIGDAHIDLSRVEIPYGETKITMNCFIGDMKVHMPNDPRIGVKLVISSFIGDGKLFDERRDGFGLNTFMETPNYHECERKVCVQLHTFIGDVKIKRVG